ncbi:MAG: PilZ domain-containing protein [Gammaproteobacteria bacterium]|jgi:type IV pilus assembly protein PilZ|nr:PilZ domain-containing protein [Gammaproteobacteria bacterium]MDT8452161.1 PilZ domain-containing protein [Gammaproteobacteria bacterium]
MSATNARPGMLSLSIKDKVSLYASYMPFVKNGGLFIPTNKDYNLGDEVFMLLSLMEDGERLPVAGKIIWITPSGAQGNRARGIGVQFAVQDKGQTRNKIETHLAGAMKADRITHTM